MDYGLQMKSTRMTLSFNLRTLNEALLIKQFVHILSELMFHGCISFGSNIVQMIGSTTSRVLPRPQFTMAEVVYLEWFMI